MAIDNRLQVFNEEGQSVDYDILASDVKFLPDGKDLPTKLAEMEQEIEEAGSGDGTVTGVKVDITTYEPTEGVVDLSEPFNDKVDKETGKELIPSTDLAKLQSLPTADQLTQQLGQKANDNAVVKSVSVNGQTPQTPTNGNVNIQVQAGEQVSVIQPDPANGTFIIRVGSTDYTINLNHTHEDMVKLEKYTEATMPQTKDDDIIYVQVDNITTPTEIQALYIFGLEFTGGGAAPGTPAITKPSGTTINLGENGGSGVSKTIEIRANSHITGDLTVGLAANSDLSFGTSNLPSGVTYNSGAGTLTIDQNAAITGVNITIVYSGSGAAEIDGGLVITGGGASPKSMVVVVAVPAPVPLTAIKLNGSQWLQTDYKPNANTEFELDVKMSGFVSSSGGKIVFDCAMNTVADTAKIFRLYYTYTGNSFNFANEESITNPVTSNKQQVSVSAVNGVRGIIKYAKGPVTGTASSGIQSGGIFSCGSSSVETSLKSSTMENALKIGHGRTSNTGTDAISDFTEFIIYGFTITENGNTVRNYVPATLDGVPGLHDTVTGEFISSETSTPVEAIE